MAAKGFQYDFFTQDWSITCGACGTPLDAPKKDIMYLVHRYHTKNECHGGW
jgi:primosomal protein N'